MNGDQNPYGIVTVPNTIGGRRRGDLLVSNFNNSSPPAGEQGTGTTIVQIPPTGNNTQGTAKSSRRSVTPRAQAGSG